MAQLAVASHRVWLARTVVVATVSAVMLGAVPSPAAAEITSVTGSAYGFWAEVSLFGGPPSERGPEPEVELAPDAADSPRHETAEDVAAVFGPATLFRGHEIDVRAEATLGRGGTVTTSARVTADLEVEVGDAQRRPGPLYYDVLESSCTVDENGEITASTTVEGGVVVTSYDAATQEPATEEDIPEDPEPGYTVEGTIDHVSDRFRIVYNEQIENADGSLTVNAAHMYLLGDIAVGDLVIGQSTCGAEISATDTGGSAADDVPAAPGGADDGLPVAAVGLGVGALVVLAAVLALVLGRRAREPEDG